MRCTEKTKGHNFCPICGAETHPEAVLCVKCGASFIQPTVNADPTAKSKLIAGLFGIFLGSFGVHNFYLGYNTKAIAQLLITLCTCGIGSTVSGIWGLIEGVMILCGNIATDADGKALTE
jgi:TM2 domain-containing membrane protein YozV